MTVRMSIDAIRAALSCISTDDRDLWVRIGMALKSELGDEGFSLFEKWSERGATFATQSVKTAWKSFKPGGAVTIATLVAEAKQRGFDPKRFAPVAPLSAADKARIKRERQERDALAAAELLASQASAAQEAEIVWSAASPTGGTAYLVRKMVTGYGVRYAGKSLLVPLVDVAGKLWNVQRVSPNGEKRFQKGGRVSGCFHIIGDAAASIWVLIAEGFATAATLHQATGYTVVVAFNATNVRHVAAAWRNQHPDSRMLICADDDRETEARTGKNPGVSAAIEAAKAVGATWCKPKGLVDGQTDFNDLAISSGINAVRDQIAAEIATHEVKTRSIEGHTGAVGEGGNVELEPDATASAQSGQKNIKPTRTRGASARKERAGADEEQSRRAFFTVDEGGVWFHGFDQRGEPMSALWICSELRVTAHSRDSANGDWGYLLEFADADGQAKRWVMPATMLAGDGTQYRSILLGMGLRIGAALMAKNQLTVYIQTEKTDRRVRCTDRIGWHDGVYVLPDRTIGNGGEEVVFQAAGSVVSQFKQRGTLDEWREHVSAHCRGNSRLLFCVSVAFAAPLLHLARMPSGGFHIWGDSSSGKSTAFKVAGSVFGGKDYPRNWRMTDNALETVAVQHSDALLLLDEIAQVDPKVVGDTVYMLANETGKGRATQTATSRRVATWRLLFLSDGEVSLANHMEQAGKGTKAGHDVRMAHIPANAGKGLGVYDTLHDFRDGAVLSDHLVKMSHRYFGTAGMNFIEYAVENAEMLDGALDDNVRQLVQDMCPTNSHGQVARVAARFALVGVAGELATCAGITGWANGEATDAARACFAAWVDGRGGAGNVEHIAILRQVAAFFQVHGEARFVWWHRATDDHKPNTMHRAGYKRMLTKEGISIKSNSDAHKEYGDVIHSADAAETETEFFVYPETFRKEICQGYDPKVVTRLLIERGLLETEAGDKAGATRKERLPGMGLMRVYKFKPSIVGAEM